MDDDDLVAISALQHFSYCARQCALIHQEQSFAENLFTARGRAVHTLVDTAGYELRAGSRLERALPLVCRRLSLIGNADLVEFLPNGTPYPVEYKHGPRRQRMHDDLQLAAQALCLEEMTGHAVPRGAIYHASSHRRREVEIGPELRRSVEDAVQAVRIMLQSGALPPAVNDARCRECSLAELCQPVLLGRSDLRRAMRRTLFSPEEE